VLDSERSDECIDYTTHDVCGFLSINIFPSVIAFTSSKNGSIIKLDGGFCFFKLDSVGAQVLLG